MLLTRRDTADRRAYPHARHVRPPAGAGVVPIVNENDTISVEQIRFGDNDTLAALVACLVEADLMVILWTSRALRCQPASPSRREPHRPR
ncbi:MAG: hypothetical protein ACLSVD_09620 [Eggerthellaceae bacterium]